MIDLIHCELNFRTAYCPSSDTDYATVQPEKGGDINVVRESQKKRGASLELVDEVQALYDQHKQGQSLTGPNPNTQPELIVRSKLRSGEFA